MAHPPVTRTHHPAPAEVCDRIGETVRALRERRQWSEATLAAHCQELGVPLSRDAIHRIEVPAAGRPRRQTTVHELLVLAHVLEVHPMALLPPDPWPGAPPGQVPHRKKKRKEHQ